ncbi:MAG: SRPBCC family protein [Vicinamibacterales bacterium]
MSRPPLRTVDPDLDLVLERVVDVPPALVWRAWTTPEILVRWFTPAPWSTAECQLDLRPGGQFRTVMRSPEGELFPATGCVLEIVPGERLVWTTLMGPGFRPAQPGVPPADTMGFTAVIGIAAEGAGTRYVAHVMHVDAGTRQRHADMGFADGWGAALDQLVATVRTL